MMNREFEILIKSASRDVAVFDDSNNLLTELKCKRNHWLSNYYSGTCTIQNSTYSIICNADEIALTENNIKIGTIKISNKGSFGRSAAIDINGDTFVLKRENLKQIFQVFTSSEHPILTIRGKLYKDRQKNIFGLIYFDDKLYHSASLTSDIKENVNILQLLTICGYCIRLFLEVDMGD